MFLKVNNSAELERFVAAPPGSVCEYHCGNLTADRAHLDDRGAMVGSLVLHQLAHRAMNLAKQGFVYLVQQRMFGRRDYAYYAVRSSVANEAVEPVAEAA